MSINYNWTIAALDCVPHTDGLTNVVQTVHWRLDGSELVNERMITGSVYATCTLPAPGDEFVAFADLTPETVLGWIWANGVDKDATEAAVTSQIETQKNPPIIQPQLPWVTAAIAAAPETE